MKFLEEGNIITIPNCDNCFIYFLIEKDEVVYVGQTIQGMLRPFQHKDKNFDTIKIIYCTPEDLDKLEEKYIKKYLPKYNQHCNYKFNYSLTRVKNNIRKITSSSNYNIVKLRKLLKQLGICYYIDSFQGSECITLDDYNKVLEYVKLHIEEFSI